MSVAARPLLLLDVDGVIALLGPGTSEPTFEAVGAGYPVLIAERTPERVRELHAVFAIVFCTSWLEDGPLAVAPLLGLPDVLPWVPCDRDRDEGPEATWKLPFVKRFVRERPCAWVDDELGLDVHEWASGRDAPTLLVEPDPRFGISDEHVEQLLTWADGLTLGVS